MDRIERVPIPKIKDPIKEIQDKWNEAINKRDCHTISKMEPTMKAIRNGTYQLQKVIPKNKPKAKILEFPKDVS